MSARARLHGRVSGLVQGVGFRPFAHGLARALALDGWVSNTPAGVELEVEGPAEHVREFARRLVADAPPPARVDAFESRELAPAGLSGFAIRGSSAVGPATALMLPDRVACAECLAEIADEGGRRYGYPFTSCTRCGPRYSIVEALPYDRGRTTMRAFPMCAECHREYEDPADRRFHHQALCCPECGPVLAWRRADGERCGGAAALSRAAQELAHGSVVALKGVGGFQLVVDAGNDAAVRTLRQRKHREEKPFAVLFGDLEAARACCTITDAEAAALSSAAAPIVLVKRGAGAGAIADAVAPGSTLTGAMLPASPLHLLLARAAGRPLVCTSANLSEEPILHDDVEAAAGLAAIADGFLTHGRGIARPLDDSVVRVVRGRELYLRRARGVVPLPVDLPGAAEPVLAVGGHFKNTVAIGARDRAFVSQHLGDLTSPVARRAFEGAVRALAELVQVAPESAVSDAHPDYASTEYARSVGRGSMRVQHHHAHVASCMADNGIGGTVLGVAWDGTGLGEDGTIWGGEFLVATRSRFVRAGHLATFRLPGGDAAARDPGRSAVGLLCATGLADHGGATVAALKERIGAGSFKTLRSMVERRVQAPETSSAGRLFDAVAALTGLSGRATFEGQAAMRVEEAAARVPAASAYPFELSGQGCVVVELSRLVSGLIADLDAGAPAPLVAARFHETLAHAIAMVAARIGQGTVALTGGCFQNARLLERTVDMLQERGLTPVWHRRVPPNDGGLSLGQLAVAVARKGEA